MYTCRPLGSLTWRSRLSIGRGGVADRARATTANSGSGPAHGASDTGISSAHTAPALARSSAKKRVTAWSTPVPPEIPSQVALIAPVRA